MVSTPIGYKGEIKIGDILLVHHNVFKFYYDMKGIEKSGKSYFRDDLFFIDPDQFFLYYNGDQWRAHSKYCFVKPVFRGLILNNSGQLLQVCKYCD